MRDMKGGVMAMKRGTIGEGKRDTEETEDTDPTDMMGLDDWMTRGILG